MKIYHKVGAEVASEVAFMVTVKIKTTEKRNVKIWWRGVP